MKPFLTNFLEIFYPKICAICDNKLIKNESVICAICKFDLPLIHYKSYTDNKIIKSFYGKIPIEKAMALLLFTKESKTKKLIHELKYKDNQEIGVFFGNWFGKILKENKQFSTIDYIIPVPLHNKRLKKRGYNQLTKFGEKLSEYLNTPFIEHKLLKIASTKTQTFKTKFERFNDNKTIFELKDDAFFENKHLLLIDDVITTGATIENCANALLKTKNIKISILAMAYTE